VVAGYGDPTPHLRLVPTPGDTRDKVAKAELTAAAQLAPCITAAACLAEPAEAEMWRK